LSDARCFIGCKNRIKKAAFGDAMNIRTPYTTRKNKVIFRFNRLPVQMEEDSQVLMAEKANQNIVQAVKKYGNKLLNFIRSKVSTDEDAEDVLQDVWYQFTNTSATETIEQVSGWLFAVARNKITDRYRKKRPVLLDDMGYDSDEEGQTNIAEILFADDTDNPELTYLKNIFWDELFLALEALPENQRTVFVQNELEDKTLQEIAVATNEKLKTIISRKGYAVQFLRKRLRHLYNDIINQ
jgi:RNA polymerase sigma factor (sigma-70 family)